MKKIKFLALCLCAVLDQKKYGYEIPFIVYTSPLFQQSHPDVLSYIREHQDESFSTADMPYMIMNAAGFQFNR